MKVQALFSKLANVSNQVSSLASREFLDLFLVVSIEGLWVSNQVSSLASREFNADSKRGESHLWKGFQSSEFPSE